MENISVILGLVVIVVIILILRAIGAWLFRINEIINEQRKTNAWPCADHYSASVCMTFTKN